MCTKQALSIIVLIDFSAIEFNDFAISNIEVLSLQIHGGYKVMFYNFFCSTSIPVIMSSPLVVFLKVWIFYYLMKCSVCHFNQELTYQNLRDTGFGEALRNYFETKTNFLNIHVQFGTESSQGRHRLIDHLTNVLYNSTGLTYSITFKKTLKKIIPMHYNLWYVNSFDAIRAIFPDSKQYYRDGVGSYVILLQLSDYQRQDTNYKIEIKKIFRMMFERSIVNVIIFLRNENGQILGYSYQPYQRNQCRKIVLVQTNAWMNGHFRNDELFPKKLKNFNNCTVRIFARNVGPFFIFNDTAPQPRAIHGIEAEALKAVAKKLNFQIELHGSTATYWGDVYRNGTITGPYLMLKQGMVDVLMGHFSYTPTRVQYFSQSISYLGSEVVALVQQINNNSENNSNWVVNPFHWTTWLCLLACIILMISLIKLMNSACFRRFRYVLNIPENNQSWTNIVGSMLGVAQTTTAVHSSIRFSIVVWNIGFFIFSAAYHAKLFDSYSHKFVPFLSNVEELTLHNYTFLVRNSTDYSLVLEELNISMANVRLLASNSPDNLFESLEKSSGHAAILSTYIRYLFYIRNRESLDVLSFVRMPLRFQQSCAYFKANSYLRDVFNEALRRIREAGLIQKWFDVDLELRYKLLKRHNDIFLRCDDHLSPLGLEKFSLIFTGFLLCQIIALCVAVIEILAHHFQRHLRERNN